MERRIVLRGCPLESLKIAGQRDVFVVLVGLSR